MSNITDLHQKRFPDELFDTLIKVKELNDEAIPFSMYKYLQWQSDPWLWIKEQVITIDQADNGIAKFFPEFAYLMHICNLYFKNKVTVCPKTRRMILTTLFACGILPHQLIFKQNSNNVFVSQRESEAIKTFRNKTKKTVEYLDMRFGFYPLFKKNIHLLAARVINPDNGSEISSVPSGADKIRGETLSNAIYDEFAFQSHCEENLNAIQPAIEGNECRAAFISSPFPGTVFEDLTKIKPGSQFTQVMQGLSITENEFNHLVIKCHYTAHPWKRTKEWYYKKRYGTTPDGTPIPGEAGVSTFTWLQEYEGEFNFPRGDRAINEYSEELHVQPYLTHYPSRYEPNFPLDISFDFGSRFPCVTFSQPDTQNRFVIHNGIMVANEKQSSFLIRTRNFLDDRFEGWEENFNLFCDPSGFFDTRGGNAEPEALELERFFGKRAKNRPPLVKHLKHKYTPKQRVDAINEQAALKCGDTHGILIAPDAGIFVNDVGKEEYGIIPKAFCYGYCYKRKTGLKEKGHTDSGVELEKDGFFDHFMDCIGFVAVKRWPSREQFKDKILGAKTDHRPKRARKRFLRH